MSLPCATCHADCCGPVVLTKFRLQRINDYLRSKPREELERLAAQKRDWVTCKFVDTQDFSCSVYPVRPRQCELYGRVAGMRCPHVNGLVNIVTQSTADLWMALELESEVVGLSNEYKWREIMGGNQYTVAEDTGSKLEQPGPTPQQVELLVCKCGDCTHWEIGHNFIMCRTCGDSFSAEITVPDHDKLIWQIHQR